MIPSSRRQCALLGLAGILSAVFFLTTLGVGFTEYGFDVLAALSVVGAVVAAVLNGYWAGNVYLSATITTLVAGGHLVATYLRMMQPSRLPPVPPTYYALTAVLALGIGLGAHGTGWVLGPRTDEQA